MPAAFCIEEHAMPWHIESDHPDCSGFAVVKDGTGEVEGCHDTEAEAEAQLAALHASEDENAMPRLKTLPARIIKRNLNKETRQILDSQYDFGDAEPYTFGAEISSDRLDAYFSRMDPATTLPNFRDDAKAGVSFLDSHNSHKLGMGHTFDSILEDTGEVTRVRADIYTIPGLRFGGQYSFASTDDFIQAAKAGIVRDVSVGFYGGREVCDMCGELVWTWDCPHFPGVEYDVGERGEQTVLATYTIFDARLAEVSAVYDGATPGATIDKARWLARAGLLPHHAINRIETRYRIRLPEGRRQWKKRAMGQRGTSLAAFLNDRIDEMAGDDMPRSDIIAEMAAAAGIESGTVNQILNAEIDCPPLSRLEGFAEALDVSVDSVIGAAEEDGCEYERMRKQVSMDIQTQFERIQAALAEAALPIDVATEPLEAVRHLIVVAAEKAELEAEIERLCPLADDGRQYREDLVTQALAEGVRAHGQEFREETYRGILESANLDTIKAMRDDWAAVAAKRFPGGRQTVDGEELETGNGRAPSPDVPAEAYKV